MLAQVRVIFHTEHKSTSSSLPQSPYSNSQSPPTHLLMLSFYTPPQTKNAGSGPFTIARAKTNATSTAVLVPHPTPTPQRETSTATTRQHIKLLPPAQKNNARPNTPQKVTSASAVPPPPQTKNASSGLLTIARAKTNATSTAVSTSSNTNSTKGNLNCHYSTTYKIATSSTKE
ncbi:unnamed protein product [Orchesella dallaii]|uniref:Uncharacterized protein n=1 Tax=Orchesella dallaii TaxID=48710 RepID=A0ABP1RYS9_9HEXA